MRSVAPSAASSSITAISPAGPSSLRAWISTVKAPRAAKGVRSASVAARQSLDAITTSPSTSTVASLSQAKRSVTRDGGVSSGSVRRKYVLSSSAGSPAAQIQAGVLASSATVGGGIE
jgi:hypothetical protein